MSEPGLSLPLRRRRRPAVSCVLCRQRKVRCNREHPCSNCIRTVDGHCVYDNPPPRPRSSPGREKRPVKIAPSKSTSVDTSSTSPNTSSYRRQATPGSSSSSHDELDTMRRQISQLEEQLNRLRDGPCAPVSIPLLTAPDEVTDGSLEPSRFGFHDSELFGCTQFVSRSVLHKKRLFGQSHWVNTAALFRDVFDAFECPQGPGMVELLGHVRKSKELARIIKARLEPPWPTLPSNDLPPRDLADQLINNYIRTSESIHRVVHIPSLRRECDAAWSSTTELEMSQVVMLKLIMAIGAATFDTYFSLRELAIRWVHEAIAWLGRPDFKARLGVKYIQTVMLLMLARSIVGVGWSMTWVSMGELIRIAFFAGLHRDPSRLPRHTFFAAELRRRLWNTLLEMDLQSCLDTGAMPFNSVQFFDTQPPGNYDDDQLEEEDPKPKPEEVFTDMSIARALRKTFPVRLAIAKFLNEIGSTGTYKDTLHLDAQLRQAYKPVSQSLRRWKPSELQAGYVDSIMRRALVALHVPFFGPSLQETAYAYTRKVVVDSSLILWRAVFTPSAEYVARTPSLSSATNTVPSDFSLVMAYRSGSFRGVAIQTVNILLAELREQVKENDDLGTGGLTSGCREIVDEAKDWAVQCIKAGETNIKGYLLIAMLGAQIEAHKRGYGREETQAAIIQAVVEAKDACVPILEEKVAQVRKGDQLDADAINAQQPSRSIDDWDMSVIDTGFDLGIMNPDNWVFDESMVDMIGL